MGLRIEYCHTEYFEGKIKPCMVPSRKNAANRQKKKRSQYVHSKISNTTAQKDGPQVVVFSESELDRMNIDSIVSSTTGSLLDMMVLMNEWV